MTDKRINIIIDSAQAEKNAKSLDSKVSGVGRSADKSSRLISELESQISATADASKKTDARIDELTKGIDSLKDESKKAENSVKGLREDINKLNRNSSSASVNANKLDDSVNAVGRSADGAQFKVKALASAIASAFAAERIVSFFSSAISAASKFEKSISDLQAITGATGDDLQFLSDAAREFGATTTLSATQSAEAIKLIASAKPDLLGNVQALKDVTKEAIALAEAAGVDLPAAAQTLGSSLNQFNLEASESGRVINALAAGAKFGSSEIQETAEALKNAGVSAAGANVSFETTNAAIQVLSANAIKGAEAGTALRNVITILDTSADKNLRPSLVGLAGALENLRAKNLSTTQTVKLFGRENINGAKILLNNIDRLKELETQLTGTSIAYEQQRIKVDNLDGDTRQLTSAYEELKITIGETFNDNARSSVQGLTDATTFLAENLDSVVSVVEILSVAVGARLATAVASSAVAFVSSVKAEANAINEANAAAAKASISVSKFTGAITQSTVAAQRATVATQLMGRAAAVASRSMALLGGPIGILAIAVSSFIAYISQAEQAASATDVLAESTNNLTMAQAENLNLKARDALESERQKISELSSEIERLSQLYNNYGERRGQASRNNEKDQARVADQIERTRVELGLAEENAAALEQKLARVATVINDFGRDQDPFGFGSTDPFESVSSRKPESEKVEQEDPEIKRFKAQLAEGTASLQRELNLRRNISRIYRQGELDADASQFEQERALNKVNEQTRLAELQAKYEEDVARRQFQFNAKLEAITLEEEQRKALQAEFDLQERTAKKIHEEEKTAISKSAARDRIKIDEMERAARIDTWSSMAQSGLKLIQAFGNDSFQSQKNFAIAEGIVNIAGGVAKALNNPYPANLGFAAQVGLQGAALIKTIRSTNPSSGGGVSSIGASSAPSTSTASAVQAAPTQQPTQIRFVIENDVMGIAEKLNDSFKELQRNGVEIAGASRA